MTYSEYFAHYFAFPNFIIFLLLAAILLLVSYGIFFIYSKRQGGRREEIALEFYSLSERMYELFFSGGCIIGFMAAYYLINRFSTGSLREIWDSYSDYLLLLFMIISISLNTIIDHLIVRLKHLDRTQMASIRLTGMLYMILIFCYIKFIYENNNYDMFITYFLTLMIGRFVYFDASFSDFINCVKGAAKNIPIMLICLCILGLMCLYGYSTGYLLKHNGVITNIFFTHLFLFVVIAALQWVPSFIIKRFLIAKNKSRFGGQRL